MLVKMNTKNNYHHHNTIIGGDFMLKMKNITKQYGKMKALDNVSLHIPKGCCYGLVGPNGAGKTTLIKIMTTIIQNYDGTIPVSNIICLTWFCVIIQNYDGTIH